MSLLLKLSLRLYRKIASDPTIINLAYDLNDKFNSKKALVIAHGLFASKASWRALARRINDQTKQKVRLKLVVFKRRKATFVLMCPKRYLLNII